MVIYILVFTRLLLVELVSETLNEVESRININVGSQ